LIRSIPRAAASGFNQRVMSPKEMSARDNGYQHEEEESCTDRKLYRRDSTLRFFSVIYVHD
jgi:hypothetical protein